jgi:hypothetical protein
VIKSSKTRRKPFQVSSEQRQNIILIRRKENLSHPNIQLFSLSPPTLTTASSCSHVYWYYLLYYPLHAGAGILTNDQLDAAGIPGTGRRSPAATAAGRRYGGRRKADVVETAERGAGARLFAVLRIHDILGWIRIWIRGSMPLTNGSGSGCGSGSCYFSSMTFPRSQQKTNCLKSFFAYYFLKVLVHHFQR